MVSQQSEVKTQTLLNGREYFANDAVPYLFPNDTDELGRLQKQHLVLRFALQGNFVAPLHDKLKQGITVLDSGCGPAAWTLEMAQDYPNSKFHGVDITNVFPEEKKPDNCEFVVGNISEHIPYPDNTFDYIHQRLLIFGLTNENWDTTLKELFRVLKPGGYIELSEADLIDLCNMGPLMRQIQYTMFDMLNARSMAPKISLELGSRLLKAGFVNQVTKVTPLDLNHGGQAGELLWDDYIHSYMNIRPLMAKIDADWENLEAYQHHIDKCAAEAEKNKTCVNWYTCYAQKPLIIN